MRSPLEVAQLTHQMIQVSRVPVSVKCRIGVDEQDTYQHLHHFVSAVSSSGVRHFIIHARKALLQRKLKPRRNLSVPELNYAFVYQLVQDFPNVSFTINGGIRNFADWAVHLNDGTVHGVMIGREAFRNPSLFLEADNFVALLEQRRSPSAWNSNTSHISSSDTCNLHTKVEVLLRYLEFAVQQQQAHGISNSVLLRPVQNLFSQKEFKVKILGPCQSFSTMQQVLAHVQKDSLPEYSKSLQ